MTAQLVGISLSVKAGEACYIPVAHAYQGVPQQLEREQVLAKLKPWLEDATKLKVGQNLKYDSHIFANHGVSLQGITTIRCWNRTCLNRTARTTWIRWRCAT
jgi:DNA polymerase-1